MESRPHSNIKALLKAPEELITDGPHSRSSSGESGLHVTVSDVDTSLLKMVQVNLVCPSCRLMVYHSLGPARVWFLTVQL